MTVSTATITDAANLPGIAAARTQYNADNLDAAIFLRFCSAVKP